MNKCKRFVVLLLLLTPFLSQYAQKDSVWAGKPTVEFSGFVDVFYAYDFNEPKSSVRQPFLFNHNRHNEFNLNLGLVKMQLSHEKYRANIGLHAGTYANDNYAVEPLTYKLINEANVGVSLNKDNNLWLDAGIFSSHLGFESAVSMDNLTLTRSLLAENSPYFLAGVKLSYQPSDKWDMSLTVCNGWQRIKRLYGNSLPGLGTQIQFKPSEKVILNWSTYVGSEDPDDFRRMRYFNDVYGIFEVSKNVNLIAGFDFGIEQKQFQSTDYNQWMSPIIIAQYAFSEKWKTAIRAEYYQDEAGVIIPTRSINGFQTIGSSLNLDYLPNSNIALRLEGRMFQSQDFIFEYRDNSAFTKSNYFIAASIAVKFE